MLEIQNNGERKSCSDLRVALVPDDDAFKRQNPRYIEFKHKHNLKKQPNTKNLGFVAFKKGKLFETVTGGRP